MTTRVLMTTVMQKRRAQWSLLPKTPPTDNANGVAGRDAVANKRPTVAARPAAVAGSHRPN